MNVGDKVRIVKCDVCEKVVGKIGTVTKLNLEVSSTFIEILPPAIDEIELKQKEMRDTVVGSDFIEVKFGKGRPQKNRPSSFACSDVVLVEN